MYVARYMSVTKVTDDPQPSHHMSVTKVMDNPLLAVVGARMSLFEGQSHRLSTMHQRSHTTRALLPTSGCECMFLP